MCIQKKDVYTFKARARLNYTTIVNIAMKILEQIITNRLRSALDSNLNEAQSWFRTGRGVQDHKFSLKQIIEKLGKK